MNRLAAITERMLGFVRELPEGCGEPRIEWIPDTGRFWLSWNLIPLIEGDSAELLVSFTEKETTWTIRGSKTATFAIGTQNAPGIPETVLRELTAVRV